jgi:hypothetical protein
MPQEESRESKLLLNGQSADGPDEGWGDESV